MICTIATSNTFCAFDTQNIPKKSFLNLFNPMNRCIFVLEIERQPLIIDKIENLWQ